MNTELKEWFKSPSSPSQWGSVEAKDEKKQAFSDTEAPQKSQNDKGTSVLRAETIRSRRKSDRQGGKLQKGNSPKGVYLRQGNFLSSIEVLRRDKYI